ncbi:hypothetical protein LCGC14_1163330 [marine sediment metagenome]|uniref:Uncharacterized protein n=1 Tax=marine sediment metagenome TaxID=412755 RepID=A0A0F9LRY2_9ZZZZ
MSSLEKIYPIIIGVAIIALLIIMFFAFKFLTVALAFLTDNFWLMLIGFIIFIPMVLFAIFYWTIYKKSEDKKPYYAIFALVLVPFLLSPQYVDAATVPLESLDDSRLTKQDLDDLRIRVDQIQADITIIKEREQPEETDELSDFDPLLIFFPIIIVQIITTLIILFFMRNK